MGRINFTLCAGAATNRCSVFASSSLVSFIFLLLFSLVLFFYVCMLLARPCNAAGWESIGANRLKEQERDEPGSRRRRTVRNMCSFFYAKPL